MMGQSRSPEICICMLKINKPKVIRSTFLFSHWNRESRTGDQITNLKFFKHGGASNQKRSAFQAAV